VSKEITLNGWVSQIPNKMYEKWVKNGWIKPGCSNFTSSLDSKEEKLYLMNKNKETVRATTMGQRALLKSHGYTYLKTIFRANKDNFEFMNDEVRTWYALVFNYVTNWLKKKGYIKLKQGSFDGGFCAETNPNLEHVKGWGAPLVEEGNKVVQIKEKFGYITVYFNSLTPKEYKQIEKFAKLVEKKFDCATRM
jgi:hypothetical protein